MGRMARAGVFCLMGLAIVLARMVEVEMRPQRLVVEARPSAPPVEIEPEGDPPAALIEEAVAAAAAPALTSPEPRIYEVRPGDTLDKISQRVYGTRRHWKEILRANQRVIPTPQAMRAGLRLTIPTVVAASAPRAASAAPAPAPAGGQVYEVRPGDTLDKISQQVYGSRRHWRKILQANQRAIPNPEAMRAGVRLTIPPLP